MILWWYFFPDDGISGAVCVYSSAAASSARPGLSPSFQWRFSEPLRPWGRRSKSLLSSSSSEDPQRGTDTSARREWERKMDWCCILYILSEFWGKEMLVKKKTLTSRSNSLLKKNNINFNNMQLLIFSIWKQGNTTLHSVKNPRIYEHA